MTKRLYEILFIADPNLGEPEVDALAAQVQGYVEKEGGVIQKIEKWGKKRLAYDVRKHREGYYILLVVEAEQSALVREIERRMRVSDGILRFITVRVDEDLKRAERRKIKHQAEDQKRQAFLGSRPAARKVEDNNGDDDDDDLEGVR
ncbi:MAG: 30S ribosomal protein S6 [Vicinamibacteria bacterium]|nr:30S ribosomal protein S6 [Vicinamibacteria bacterium]